MQWRLGSSCTLRGLTAIESDIDSLEHSGPFILQSEGDSKGPGGAVQGFWFWISLDFPRGARFPRVVSRGPWAIFPMSVTHSLGVVGLEWSASGKCFAQLQLQLALPREHTKITI